MQPSRQQTWKWLESTHELQIHTYHYDLERFVDGLTAEEREITGELARYLDWNTTAAVQELAEVREEFSWKPWATDEPFVSRDRVRDEIIDVLHFLGNMLVGIGVDDDELQAFYELKQTKNRQRAASGTYSARKGGLAAGSDK